MDLARIREVTGYWYWYLEDGWYQACLTWPHVVYWQPYGQKSAMQTSRVLRDQETLFSLVSQGPEAFARLQGSTPASFSRTHWRQVLAVHGSLPLMAVAGSSLLSILLVHGRWPRLSGLLYGEAHPRLVARIDGNQALEAWIAALDDPVAFLAASVMASAY